MSPEKQPTTVEIHGAPLLCLVCKHDLFWRRQVQLNTPWLTFFKLDWLNRVSTSVVCERCGYVHSFLPPGK